jgi:lysine biosynthesis protein LysW
MEDDKMIKCIVCGDEFELDEYDEEGDLIICPSCDSEMELASISPPKVVKPEYDDFEDDMDEDSFDFDDQGDDI